MKAVYVACEIRAADILVIVLDLTTNRIRSATITAALHRRKGREGERERERGSDDEGEEVEDEEGK